jgi:hypothetical protein
LHILKDHFILSIFLLVFSISCFGNNFKAKDTIPKPSQIIDSLVFSENLDWSVRLVTNFKQQQFRLRNENNKLLYMPNNPFGVGFGIANQKMVIDIIINLKTGEEEEHTTKFAAEGAIILNRNLFGFTLENVNGYEVSSRQNLEENFREDIRMFSLGLEYLRVLSKNTITVRGMKSGLPDQQKSFVSYGLGGFFLMRHLDAGASIIPDSDREYFNEQAEIYDYSGIGAGVLAGFNAYFALPANFFATVLVSPGIGFEYKYVKTETDNYAPSNPLLLKTDLFASLGYNRKKFYVHFTFGTDWYLSSLNFDNDVFLSVTKSKIAVGYEIGKIFKKKKAF